MTLVYGLSPSVVTRLMASGLPPVAGQPQGIAPTDECYRGAVHLRCTDPISSRPILPFL